jgi:hypothetical protein
MLAKKCFFMVVLTLVSFSFVMAQDPPVHPKTGEPLVIDCLRGTVTIDGDLSDWNLRSMTPAVLDTAEQLYMGHNTWDNPNDSSGQFYLLWDDVNIYIAVVMKDDKLFQNKTGGRIWNADAIEILFSTLNAVSGHNEHYQYGFDFTEQTWHWCNMDGRGNQQVDYLHVASSITDDGYICEASIEYGRMLSLDWSIGNTIGFHPVFDDTDIENGDRQLQMTWTGLEAHDQSQGFGHMYLSDTYVSSVTVAQKNVFYVDDDATGKNDGSSWANAYRYLQDALADANEAPKPVEIRVAQGTYTPDRGVGQIRWDWNSKFLLKSGTTIKGGFAGVGADDPNAWDYLNNPTILTADLNKDDLPDFANRLDNSYHVIWCLEGDASAVLDSVTITGGDAVERQGGGMFNYQARPTIKRCHFMNNYAAQGGAMTNTYSSPTIINCTFSGNLCDFSGGGMYNDYSHPIVESCVFYDNRTTILGGGGMYCGGSDPTITNCLFIDNGAPFGGGMYNVAADPNIINCTFSNNYGGAWGGGMQNDAGANPRVTNCILWGDIPDEISFSGTGTVTYSNVQGGWAGVGNINSDPKFADFEGRLSADSPCIDAGKNDAVSSDITSDLDGNPRIINGTVDMGAYEFGSPPPGPSADPLAEALDTTLIFTTGGDAEWFSQSETYYHDHDAAQSGPITDDQESWMQTSVNGAGTLRFYWRVSSEGSCDYLEFYIDGMRQDRISDSEDWHEMSYEITGSDSHTLEWRYFKDGTVSEGDDCGWVDKVEWMPIP